MLTAAAGSIAISDDWQAVAAQLIADVATVRDPSMAFLYVSDHLAHAAEHLRHRIVTETGVNVLSGTVSVGVLGGDHECMDAPGASLLMLATDGPAPTSFRVKETVPHLGEKGAPIAIVHADPGLQSLVDADVLGDTYAIGGLSASRQGSFQFDNNGAVVGGATGVLLPDAGALVVGVSQGYRPLGPFHRVTRCQENALFTLDDRPPLEVLCEDAGVTEAGELGQDVACGIALPHRDTEDYLVRNIVGGDRQSGALIIAHPLEDGGQLAFTRRDQNTARYDLQQVVRGLVERVPSSPQAALYFSCVGRGENLFGQSDVELSILREQLGTIPIAGFFGNGEIACDQIYGYTGVLALFV